MSEHACRLLPLDLQPEALTRLEYAWGMSYRSLNYDGVSALTIPQPELKVAFEAGECALLPTKDTLMTMWHFTNANRKKNPADILPFPTFPTSMLYRIVPKPTMKSLLIRSSDEAKIHSYPFQTLLISSNTPPNFITADFGQKFTFHVGDIGALSSQTGIPSGDIGCAIGLCTKWNLSAPASFVDPQLPNTRRSLPEGVIDEEILVAQHALDIKDSSFRMYASQASLPSLDDGDSTGGSDTESEPGTSPLASKATARKPSASILQWQKAAQEAIAGSWWETKLITEEWDLGRYAREAPAQFATSVRLEDIYVPPQPLQGRRD